MHKVKDGAVDDSYGIQVAKLADLPEKVISRAQVILSEFEASAGKKSSISNLKMVENEPEINQENLNLSVEETTDTLSQKTLNKHHLICLKMIKKARLNYKLKI